MELKCVGVSVIAADCASSTGLVDQRPLQPSSPAAHAFRAAAPTAVGTAPFENEVCLSVARAFIGDQRGLRPSEATAGSRLGLEPIALQPVAHRGDADVQQLRD